MPKAARNQATAAAEPAALRASPPRAPKIPILLLTGDDALWPQVGADLAARFLLSQLDGVDELLSSTAAGSAAIVLWDARGHADAVQTLSRIQVHSDRFAVVVLDEVRNAGVWTLPLQHRQLVAHVGLPVVGAALVRALDGAAEEVQARAALLGGGARGSAAAAPTPPARGRVPLVPLAVGAVLVAAAGGWLLLRHAGSDVVPSVPPQAVAAKSTDAKQDQLDTLIEKAQQAMAERHFIEPAAGSALALYRDALLIDPANGEARQGLDRLAEILVTRIQAALDERRYDVALQALETVRSINPADARLAAFDEKISALRAELGPAQIMAAINAQNFDRAAQLIDDAARARSLSAARIAQLRDELRKHHDENDQSRLLKLVDTRLQQDRLVEPRGDSAAFYLDQARKAGVAGAQLQAPQQDLQQRLAQQIHAAIDQHRLGEAERGLAELQLLTAPPASVAALQRELAAARGAGTAQKSEQSQLVELAQQRLVQGRLAEPDNDSALYYLAQLRASDARSPALDALGTQLQSQLLEGTRTALEGGDLPRAEVSLQQAQSLGSSAEADSLAERLRSKQRAGAETPRVSEQSLTRLAKLELSYPASAQKAGVEGVVEIGYTIKADGSVANVSILNATPPGAFDQAATRAVSRLRYQPVIRDGKPTAVSTQIRLVFRLPT